MLTFDGLVIIHNGDWLVDRKKYRVYINSPHGTVTATPKKGFPGTVVTLTNEPDLGYDFSSYTVQGATLSGNTFVIDHQDVYVTGNFSLHDYTITVTQPSGGTISAPSTAHYGDTVILGNTPSAGYELDHYIVNGQPIEGNTFTMPADNVTVTAAYNQLTYTITYSDRDPDLPASYIHGTITGPTTAHYGDSITVTVTADDFYEFSYLKVNGVQISGKTFTCTGNTTVQVKFVDEVTPWNPLGLRDNTMRFRFGTSSFDPRSGWPSSRGGTWTKVSDSQFNDWDYYNANSDWSYKFSADGSGGGGANPLPDPYQWQVLGANTRRVTNMSYLFANMTGRNEGPTRIHNSFDTRKVTDMSYAFYAANVTQIRELPLNSCMSCYGMYARCDKIQSGYSSGSGITAAYNMAKNTLPSGADHDFMFYECRNSSNAAEYDALPSDWK